MLRTRSKQPGRFSVAEESSPKMVCFARMIVPCRSFESISSTEQALSLLRQIQGIMQRDTLRADLEAKYLIIFQHYGLDMEAVQKAYEKHKVRQACLCLSVWLVECSFRGQDWDQLLPEHGKYCSGLNHAC
jgi:hypothetical protein